jgi:hypothetical protein
MLEDKDGVMMQAFKEVLGKIASKLLQGDFNLIQIPAPAVVHSTETSLSLMVPDLSFGNKYLTMAAKETDPAERIKHILSFILAPTWVNPTVLSMRSPLNPILGETLQREFKTGEKLFCEQISHHPPITAYALNGNDDEYIVHGCHQYQIWVSGA